MVTATVYISEHVRQTNVISLWLQCIMFSGDTRLSQTRATTQHQDVTTVLHPPKKKKKKTSNKKSSSCICVHQHNNNNKKKVNHKSSRNSPPQPPVPTASPNRHPNSPIRLPPPLRDGVPDRQIVPRELERDRDRLPRLHRHVREALQDGRRFARGGRHV